MIRRHRAAALAMLLFIVLASAAAGGRFVRIGIPSPNPSGIAQTLVAGGEFAPADEPFFDRLGSNGRTCMTCHVPTQGWSLEPTDVQRLFAATAGRHPLFRPVDGSTSPLADVSTVKARRSAYALLLERGVIRVGLPVPANAEFELIGVDDPYDFASAAELSLFRRPLPATNLAFLSAVMWDGRESPGGRSIAADLTMQANDATVGHAEAAPIDEATRQRIVAFEMRLTTAQIYGRGVGLLTAEGAAGGPAALAVQPYWPNINSRLDPTSITSEPFTIFKEWTTAVGRHSAGRQAVARGQLLFNERRHETRLMCSSCHNTPNVGSNSTGAFFDVGVSHANRRTPDLPLYTFRCRNDGAVIQTTDPGRALISGRCTDIGRFKVPSLRGLASRAPYFHDGSASTLEAVVDHYEQKFGFLFVGTDKADLVAFLSAL
jgi:cytochrome c peroxidase